MNAWNPTNERIKRKYFIFLEHALGLSTSTIDAVAAAIDEFESFSGGADFTTFDADQAVEFKQHYMGRINPVTLEARSAATAYSTFGALKRFFEWLGKQPGYRVRLNCNASMYLRVSGKDARIATARREPRGPTMDQLLTIIRLMPHSTDTENRDRAIFAIIACTGARDAAVRTFKLKHYDPAKGTLLQDAREVSTKFSKTFVTHLFAVSPEFVEILRKWVELLRNHRDWTDDDPLFPATATAADADGYFSAGKLSKRHWSNAQPIRDIFRRACARANIQYFAPHTVRHTLTRLGMEICHATADMRAWSLNFGHDDIMTTLQNYGMISEDEQRDRLDRLRARASKLGKPTVEGEALRRLRLLVEELSQNASAEEPKNS